MLKQLTERLMMRVAGDAGSRRSFLRRIGKGAFSLAALAAIGRPAVGRAGGCTANCSQNCPDMTPCDDCSDPCDSVGWGGWVFICDDFMCEGSTFTVCGHWFWGTCVCDTGPCR